jgi:hypothetical protein
MNQDFHAERPDQRDIFLLEREFYNEDNNYLLRSGFIILLQGAPTPDLHTEIAAKLAQEHGLPIEHFFVRTATISPYLLICMREMLRDEVVRRGVYTILNLGIQFRVSELRPRFGMAYDPPTHQACVILRGAPL